MQTKPTETVINEEQPILTRYIPLLLQVLLIMTVMPYLSHGEMVFPIITKDCFLFGALLLLFLVAGKARHQSAVTGLVIADTAIVSYLFASLASGESFLPYPYFVILMIALLGQNMRHTAASVAALCAGYLGVLYQHQALSQQHLLLVPVLVIMAALVTCHVFQAELLAARASRIQQHVSIDPLTGLPNRAAFIDHVWNSMHSASRFTDDLFAVLFIDLDGFKAVNDQLGHRAGDELLRGMADRLRLSLRKGDMLARYGGDEFCVLLARVHSKSEAMRTAERLPEKVKAPLIVANGRATTVGASIGIALSSNIHSKPQDLIRDADAAMYRVKQHGKNGIAVSDQLADLSQSSSSSIISARLAQS